MSKPREITGKTVFMITASAFAVIIGVNLYMATSAVRTFPGLEVENSYVASQKFDAQAIEQRALKWTLTARAEDGKFLIKIVDVNGDRVYPRVLDVRIGRPTIDSEDQNLVLHVEGDTYVADADLADGKWYAYVDAKNAEGVSLTQRLEFYVGGAIPEWTLGAGYQDGQLHVSVKNTVGDPVFPKAIQVQVERISISGDGAADAVSVARNSGEAAPGALELRTGNQTIMRDAQTVKMHIGTGEYVGDVKLGNGKWYAYIDATTSDDVQLTQRLEFQVTGGDE